MIYVSKSGLFDFRWCQTYYRYRHLDRIGYGTKSQAVLDGLRYHNAFEKKSLAELEQGDSIEKMFVEHEKKRLQRVEREFREPFAVELWIENEELRMRGRIDRVNEEPDGSYVVVEYKPRHSKLIDEIAFYAALVEKEYNVSVKYGAVYGYRTGKCAFWTVKKKHKERILKEVRNMLQVVDSGKFQMRDDSACIKCLFVDNCIEVMKIEDLFVE